MNQKRFFYQIGGSLANDSPSYVERSADRELETYLKQGEFCYVLNSRQMGKSSLRVRIISKLQAIGIVCVFVDLTAMGSKDLTPERWYAGIVRSIVSACQLHQFDWRNWWREQRDLFSPVQRFSLFIEEILLVAVTSKIVIFIDEIDRVLSQNFLLDDFFATIHSCYRKRQINPAYYRLTFTLLGVAAPRDLIRDKTQSPFELGRAINLRGFQLNEVYPLKLGLVGKVDCPQETLAEILLWTAGQPFLTQKLCHLVYEQNSENDKLSVANIVEQYLINDWEVQDEPEHLRTIRDRLCHRNSTKTIRLLSLYREILQHESVSVNSIPAQIELRLSGLVIEKKGKLVVNNPIYAQIFNLAWTDEQLAQLRPYSKAIALWQATNDSAYLLQGQDLQNALTWALGKSLADIDYQFLVASQDLAKQQVEDTLAAVAAASKLLATVRKQASRQANRQRLNKQWLIKIVIAVTGFILLLCHTGILQSWEWNLLDRFFRWRLTDNIDPRIVVVTIDERDINTVGQLPIPDRILATAINELKANRPKAIALDIYRDLPVAPGTKNLQELFQSMSNLYAVEKIIGEATPPPSNLSKPQVGFADLVLDSDGKVRRALLSLVGEDKQLRLSIATKIALHYLQDKKIELKQLDRYRYSLGKTIFQRFTANSGGYVGADAGGYQVLLNYWGTAANFRQYSLTEVLNGKVTRQEIRDRLIFIGSTVESVRDSFYTPYSQGWFRAPAKMPGVFVQANITSQIINAAIDNRPLLRTQNQLVESLWILLWGTIGIALSWRWQSWIAIAISLGIASLVLIAVSYYAFVLGWWLPLIPALLTLTLTAFAAIAINNRRRERVKFQHILTSLLTASRDRPTVGTIALEYFKQSENKANIRRIDNAVERIMNN